MEEKFILASLKEDKAKKLAEVISNKSCRKILNFLSDKKEASEGEISKELGIPISTVHYNVKLLLSTGLIESKEFKWSPKGKQVDLYKLAKKLIVIAPSGTRIKSKLRTIVPVALISLVGAGVIHLLSKFVGTTERVLTAPVMDKSAVAGQVAEAVAMETVKVPSYGLWFLFGALFAILIYYLWSLREK